MGGLILQGFLVKGLIDVGGDDTKLEKLSQAAKDLASALKKKPSKALSYSLIAFDPDAPEDDPVVQEALAALQKRWVTYRNTFADMPISVVRAILLDAIVDAATEDDRVGVCFVASARNALPLMPVDSERDIWIDIVKKIERRVDEVAEKEWATPETISIKSMKYQQPSIGSPKITFGEVSEADLQIALRAAAGPHDQSNNPTNGNRYFPNQNPANWVSEFGDMSGTAISDAINSAISEVAVSDPDLSEPFGNLVSAVSGYVDEALNSFSAATAGLQRRTKLLWWREALYSPSAAKSYRELSPTTAAALMALDLFETVPLFTPASVSAFLGETVLRLGAETVEAQKTICELVKEAQDHDDLSPLRAIAAKLADVPEGRGPLLALIGHPAHANARREEDFQRLTGLSPSSKLDPVSWAGWLFRELQASKAAIDALSAKRRPARNA
ncbi:GTPase-associated system all-helical protein GASH [Tropicibacter naphthalenivorans]|uniref:GTPase-associated system helical domain-containing protein n=1 Tax=Tropicibacter naphthalenivorans TaxID=441103 RepID=A0A0P1GXN3_9RHOB|nr:GTPase-associated system all-helical protein GASH [Tropicibacter naphthalenivorans]CUH81426.1 hypothetical protein TRN7648_03462 [Tropicibacter naphthalenivorans]SMD00478.1 hypothetical protein SAMN04488093_109128 [Tropicibacter naphthalenivorans]